MKPPKTSQPFAFEFFQFLAIAAVGMLFGALVFYRLLGIVGAIHGLAMMWTRNIPVGIENKEPSIYLTGTSAVIAGLIFTAACLALSWFAPEVGCYFSEGRQCP
jgi:hypothetical protein